jgi:hypothetical protein
MDKIKHEFNKSDEDLFDIEKSVVGVLNSGLGNKIFLMFEHLYIFNKLKKIKPELKLYFINQRSHHERKIKFDFELLFEKHKDFSFINWHIFDKHKKGIKQTISKQPLFSSITSDSFYSTLKTPLCLDYILEKIPDFKQSFLDSLNIIVKDPFLKDYELKDCLGVHVRYGDKLQGATFAPDSFLLANPIFYIDAIRLMRKKNELVIFYTDSPKIVQEFILPYIDKPYLISNSSVEESFKEMTIIPKLILTDSTLPLAAIALRKKSCSILLPSYNFKVKFPNILFETRGLEHSSKTLIKPESNLSDETSKFIKTSYLHLDKISSFSIHQLITFL